MQSLIRKLEALLEKGGTKKDVALLLSIFKPFPLPFDPAWVAIILCGVPIILEAVIGLITAFDIKADVLVSLALIASVCIGEDFAAGEVAFIMQLGALLEYLTVARARAGIEKLVKLTPQTARVLTAQGESIIAAQDVQAGAMLRTTIAFTTQSGSDAYNVIPQEATLGANMRFIPHQGEQESLAIIQTLAEKHGLSTEVLHANDFTPPVDIHGEAFTLFTRVIGETFPGLAASPYVMTGATDAQFYQPICKSCIRFAPVIYGPEQMKGMHGLNENIEYNCLPGAVRFYQNLIRAEK